MMVITDEMCESNVVRLETRRASDKHANLIPHILLQEIIQLKLH